MKNITFILCIFWLIVVAYLLYAPTINAAEEVSYSYGKDTFIHSINHTDSGDSYAMHEVAVRFDNNFEFSLINHEYNIHGIDNFDTVSFGIIQYWTYEWEWFYTELGIGFRYAERNRNIKWLMHKHLLADFSGAVGIKYKNIKLAYKLRHFSAPGSDTGQNLDQITGMLELRAFLALIKKKMGPCNYLNSSKFSVFRGFGVNSLFDLRN